MHINAGNTSNLKPELVLKSMESFFGCSISDIDIERKEIYFEDIDCTEIERVKPYEEKEENEALGKALESIRTKTNYIFKSNC